MLYPAGCHIKIESMLYKNDQTVVYCKKYKSVVCSKVLFAVKLTLIITTVSCNCMSVKYFKVMNVFNLVW